MADLTPKIAEKLAKRVRMLHSDNQNERRKAFAAFESELEGIGADWRDIGNWIEQLGNWIEQRDDGKYTEAEMQEFGQAQRAEGVEVGIKLGLARASNGGGNSHSTSTLPTASVMAAYCYQRRDRLNDWEQEFIDNMHLHGVARRYTLKPKQKSKLQEIYQQLGGT